MFWTAKEAIIKALGKRMWEAELVPEIGIENGLFFLYSGSTLLKDWTLELLNFRENYIACVAVNCPKLTKKIHLCEISATEIAK